MTKALRVPDYLGHILKAIERIDRYTADMDEVGFLGSELVQDAVIRNIEIIGEASNNSLHDFPLHGFILKSLLSRGRFASAASTCSNSPGRSP